MEYNEHKPIYLQIADKMCVKIILDEWKVEERIPSVREMAALMGVNPNTVVRSYDYMEAIGTIYNKRGIGFFVKEDARNKILKILREEFIREDIPALRIKLSLINIDKEELCKLLV